ncbi:MAG: hypothetical protein H6733_13200 [Alphaproteobacteria bacterium]|nr:hypothetical protein [Alphaproteobacteria bacterium]
MDGRRTRALLALLTLATAPLRALADTGPEADEVPEITPVQVLDAPPPPADAVHLVYTGGANGLGTERYLFEVHGRLQEALGDGTRVTRAHVVHGTLHQAGHAVWADDGTVASSAALVARGAPVCDPPVPTHGFLTPTELVVLPPGAPVPVDAVRDADTRDLWWHACHQGDVHGVWVASAPDAAPDWEPLAFDVRTAVRLSLTTGDQAWTLPILGLPRQEGARRVATIDRALADHPGSLFVDAGNFVDGASTVKQGEMSLLRDAGLDVLARLRPAALVPGANELAPGPDALRREAALRQLVYIAANWRASDPKLALPGHRTVTVDTREGPVDVAFVGLIDPVVALQAPLLAAEGVTLADPIDSVQAEVDALVAQDDPPDLVVLVSFASPDLQTELRSRLHGVDLFLGDRWGATLRVAQQTIEARTIPRAVKSAPLTLPMDGVGHATLTVHDGRLDTVTHEPLLVRHDAVADAATTRAITSVRLATYPDVDDDLLPPHDADDPLGTWSAADFDHLVCEAVLTRTGADAVFLPGLPSGTLVPGPLTVQLAAQRLAVLDVLEVHRVDGDRMTDFLEAARAAVPTVCGAQVGTRGPKVLGRSVDAERTYRVVTTDRARLTTPLGGLMDAGNEGQVLQVPKWHVLRDAGGKSLALAPTALRQLAAWRDARDGDAWVATVAGRSPTTTRPTWLFELDQLAFQASAFARSARPDAYEAVPETQLNSPNSWTIGGNYDMRLVYGGPRVVWDLRALGAYASLQVAGAEAQESADDWQISTSLELPVAEFPPRTKFRLRPYTELRFDSEFTPIVGTDDVTQPRQADLSLALGLSAVNGGWLKKLRLGAFVNQDMGRLANNVAGLPAKSPEYGGRLELQTQHDLLRASSVRLNTSWDASVFGTTPDDDAADLRFRLWGELRIKLRLIRWLDVDLYGQGLAAQGRVPETQEVAVSGTLGAALDLAAAFRFARQVGSRVR